MNIAKLPKDDILWMAQHRCKHHVAYLQHPRCYDREVKDRPKETVGFLDIETTNLNASFGYMLCWCIKPDGDKIESHCITPREIRTHKFDERLVHEFYEAAQKYDRLIGYYSSNGRFDVPFLRTRALKWGADFPEYGDNFFTDCYDYVKKKMRLHRNRLEVACDLLEIPSKAHRLNPDIWQKAQAGDSKSLDWILKHCQEDVTSLEQVWKRLQGFGRLTKTSI